MGGHTLDCSAANANLIADAILSIGQPGIFDAIQRFLRAVAPHEMNAAFLYVDRDPPTRVYDSEGSEERDSLHDILAKIGYLLSPYYNGLILTGEPGGFYHIDDVAPDEFRQSEYFEAYYGRKHVRDEGMYLCPLGDGTALVFMVERHLRSDAFDAGQVDALKRVAPVVTAIATRHVATTGLKGLLPADEPQKQARFKDIADSFGRDVLSPRERDVAMLILKGHSTKSAARSLKISPETERVHRRRLYAKLGLTSHSELFWLFFEASDFYEPGSGNDPLASYLSADPSDAGTTKSGL